MGGTQIGILEPDLHTLSHCQESRVQQSDRGLPAGRKPERELFWTASVVSKLKVPAHDMLNQTSQCLV